MQRERRKARLTVGGVDVYAAIGAEDPLRLAELVELAKGREHTTFLRNASETEYPRILGVWNKYLSIFMSHPILGRRSMLVPYTDEKFAYALETALLLEDFGPLVVMNRTRPHAKLKERMAYRLGMPCTVLDDDAASVAFGISKDKSRCAVADASMWLSSDLPQVLRFEYEGGVELYKFTPPVSKTTGKSEGFALYEISLPHVEKLTGQSAEGMRERTIKVPSRHCLMTCIPDAGKDALRGLVKAASLGTILSHVMEIASQAHGPNPKPPEPFGDAAKPGRN